MTSLADRVQALPRELYDQIVKFTFSVSYGERIYIDKTFRPPGFLQVSTDTREDIAYDYYNRSTFYIHKNDFASWAISLEAKHVEQVRDVRVIDYTRPFNEERMLEAQRDVYNTLRGLQAYLPRRSCHRLSFICFKLKIHHEGMNEDFWVSGRDMSSTEDVWSSGVDADRRAEFCVF